MRLLKRLLRGAVTGLFGLVMMGWAGSLLSGSCAPGRFGCAVDDRLWLWLILAAGAALLLSAAVVWVVFVREFRGYLKDYDERKGKERGWRLDRLREEAERVAAEIAMARDILAQPAAPESGDLPAAEFQGTMDIYYRRVAAEFIVRAENEPVRIVAWLLARMIDLQAIDLQYMGEVAMLGTVSINHDQQIQCVLAGSGLVTLMQIDLKTPVGDPFEAKEMIDVLEAAKLPVWPELRAA